MSGRSAAPRHSFPGLNPQVSRRAVLGGLASMAVLFGTPSLAMADTRSSKASPFVKPSTGPKRLRDADGNPVPPTPYAVQASCELSEDYFLTADVLVGADDEVVPFVNHLNGGAVEAVVVSQEAKTVSHVYRDPSALSGWTIKPIAFPAAMGSVAQVAVAASPKGVYLATVAPPDSNGQTLSWFSCLTDAITWTAGNTLGPGAPLEMLRAGVSPDQTPYFYGWAGGPVTVDKVDYLHFQFYVYICDSQTQAPTMRTVLDLQLPAADKPNIPDAVLMYDVNDSGSAVHGVAAVLQTVNNQTSGTMYVYPQSAVDPQGHVIFDAGGSLYDDDAEALLWANSAAPRQWQVMYSQAGDLVYMDQAILSANKLYGFGSDLAYGDTAVWVEEGAYTFVVLNQGVVSVLSQAGANAPFSLPVPLTAGVERIYSAVTDPEQSTLFTVLADTTLNVLTKDPTSGWTQHQVHQDTAQAQEVESYRTMISILDANGVGVPGGQASISTDRLVGMWQEPATNTIIEPGTQVTLTADYQGRITVSIPAEELDCAILSVQALGPDSKPTGDALLVTPHVDVTNFLAGKAPLTDVDDSLTGAAMSKAQDESNNPLFPNLGGDSGAAAAAAAVNHVANLGLGAQPSDLGGTSSAVFDMTGSKPTFQSSTTPNAYSLDTAALNTKRRHDADRLNRQRHHGPHHGHPHHGHPGPIGDVGGVGDWWDSVKHDADSAFHGLRHGAIKFKKMVSTWASDTKQWTVDLVVDIGNGLDSVMTYVVDDVKTAVHAISSFFQALGADIKSGVDWLKNHVIDYLKAAGANATIIQGWFSTAIGTTATPGPFYTVLDKAKAGSDGYFTNLAAEAHSAFAAAGAALGDQSFGDAGPVPGLTKYTGSIIDKTLKDALKLADFMQHSPAAWLLHKFENHLPHTSSGLTPVAALGPVIDDLATVFADVLTEADDIVALLQTTASDLFPSKSGYSDAKISQWLAAVDKTVEDGVTVLEAISDTVFDVIKCALDAMLDTLAYEIPVLGDGLIGWLFKKAGIDPTISVGHLVSLVAAYPATLFNDIINDAPLFPTTETSAERRGLSRTDGKARHQNHRLGAGTADWRTGLGVTAAVVQMIWGLNDVAVDVQVGKDEDGNEKSAPAICDWIDIFAPVILTILQWPSAEGSDGSTEYPFYGFIDRSSKYDWMLPNIILSGLAPSAFGLASKLTPIGASGTGPHGTTNKVAQYYSPAVQMISGIINTGIGTAFNIKTSAGGPSIAAGVLGNLSYILALLNQKWVNQPAEDVPVMIKTFVDFFGNIGAGICMMEATSLPPK